MKKAYLFIAFSIIFLNLNSQELNVLMMPQTADTFFYRNITNISDIDESETGENYFWDFSEITSNNWIADTFVSISSTPIAYSAVFNNPMSPDYRATIASPRRDISIPVGGFSFSRVYNFYKLNEGEDANSFTQIGIAATVNNIPIPIKHGEIDIIYQLPSYFGHQDSSYSHYKASIPTIGFYQHQQTRYNYFDGYGTLKTPAETYENVIRVKTVIEARDSIFSQQYNFPFALNSTTIEYKWYAQGHVGAVAQISITGSGNNNIKSFKYRDIPEETSNVNENEIYSVNIYPNPASEKINFDFGNSEIPKHIRIYDISGKIIYENNKPSRMETLNTKDHNIRSGNYLYTLTYENKEHSSTIIVR